MIMPERIFVPADRSRVAEITAYLYYGWQVDGYGAGPAGTVFASIPGFFLGRVDDASGPGFGTQALRNRLASGLFASIDIGGGS